MKTIISMMIAATLTMSVFATNEKDVKSKIKNVTVFANGAQVSRTASFSAGSGVTDIVFEGVSPYLNPKSIQVEGDGDYIILDVQFRVKQPVPPAPYNVELPKSIVKDIALLQDSLSQLGFDIDDVNAKKDVLNLEKKVLLGNKFMQGNVDTIPELKQAMEYLRKQLNDINESLNKIKRDEFKLNKEKARMEQRLNSLRSYNTYVNPPPAEGPKYQVVVSIQSKAAVSGTMSVSYMVSNAGWTPSYDIRATEAGKPVQLVLKANVYQSSGEEWDNVKLKLSTITPGQGLYKPQLPALYLSYFTPQQHIYSRDDKNKEMYAPMAQTDMEMSKASCAGAPASYSYQYTQEAQTLTNIEYNINLPYSIPNDGQYHIVAVKEHNLDADYVHYLVPRIDREAYLVAKVTGWNSLDLLPANANIYFNGTFVGETYINTGVMSDTMELALGKDRSIVIERKKLPDETKNELIGSNVTKTVKYELKIKNNKGIPVNLIVEDQIPIASTTDIKINKLSVGGAEYNETSGQLTWQIKLSGQQTKNLSYSWSVEYDKNKQLANVY
ncbi:MAG: DUF4139 domain-containing protein [Bacteroidetes bacterium]|nr:DUF4139 domain-containing protein [Bacteroidota bacterium]MBU1717555.1 DUF4139 domain-containing protein [Bacteroidota bacterium]